MALYKADGTELTDANVTGIAGAAIVTNTYKVTEDIFDIRKITSGTESVSKRLKFHKNQIITQTQLNEALALSKDA